MRKQAFFSVVGALGLLASPAWATKTNFTSNVTDELSDTGVRGTGVFTYDDATRVLCGRLTMEGLDEITFKKLELNEAFEEPRTEPANRQDLTPAITSPKDPVQSPIEFGIRIAPDALAEALLSELTYINIRSEFTDKDLGAASGGLVKAPDGETVTCAAQTSAPIVDAGTGPGTGTPTDGAPSGAGAGTFDSGIHDIGNDDGGCSTTGDASFAGNCGLFAIAGLGLALFGRARRRT